MFHATVGGFFATVGSIFATATVFSATATVFSTTVRGLLYGLWVGGVVAVLLLLPRCFRCFVHELKGLNCWC